MDKDDSQLENCEECISCNPHGSHQCEVVHQSRGKHANFKCLHLVDASHKEDQHEDHGQAELNPELGIVSLSQFPE